MRGWLKDSRTMLNMSQQELAEKVGVSREYITMIENNERMPSVSIAKKIEIALNIDWTIFLSSKVTDRY